MAFSNSDPLPAYDSMSQEEVEREAPDWYSRWRARIHDWVRAHSDSTLASIVTLVPDLLVLTIRLAKDPRVPFLVKGQLILAAAYVISPIDFLPEAALGVIGLAEDAGVLALVLYWLKHMGRIDTAVLHDNWPGREDVDRVIDGLHDEIERNREKIIGADVWQKIEQRFGKAARQQRQQRSFNPLRRFHRTRSQT
jgi:uncharacterized membrane protein YkvA (DUF1232 family)